MKFIISRTSGWLHNEKPCHEAMDKIKYHNKYGNEEERFTIEINTLEELIAFVEKYDGYIVLSTSQTNEKPLNEIEIYDDYRE